MAGYSGTALTKKLGIGEGAVVALVGAPEGFEEMLQPLPDSVQLRDNLRGSPSVVLFFTKERAALERKAADLGRIIHPAGSMWVAWPKRTSKVKTDMTENTVRDVVLPLGMVDTKVCAIDDTWSGLRLVWRRTHR